MKRDLDDNFDFSLLMGLVAVALLTVMDWWDRVRGRWTK